MFRRVTFKAWRNLAANQAKREELGTEVYNKLYGDKIQAGLEEVVYEKPPVYVEYTSEEEIETQADIHALAEGEQNS